LPVEAVRLVLRVARAVRRYRARLRLLALLRCTLRSLAVLRYRVR
jgi:hypothetical protein